MSLTPEFRRGKVGVQTNPVDDVNFVNSQGTPQSLRDLEMNSGSDGQPFTVTSAGDVMMDPDKVSVGTGGYIQSPGVTQYMVAPYVGTDRPGEGNNTLINLQSRIWREGENGRVYLITRISNLYFCVEMTTTEGI